MIIDRYTKFVMTVIAVALLMIGLNPWIAPTKAYAELEPYDISLIETNITAIRNDVSGIASDLSGLSSGHCSNGKLC